MSERSGDPDLSGIRLYNYWYRGIPVCLIDEGISNFLISSSVYPRIHPDIPFLNYSGHSTPISAWQALQNRDDFRSMFSTYVDEFITQE